MTVRQYFDDMLQGHGLWPNEAKAVLDLEAAKKETQGVKWNDEKEAYPITLLVALQISIWTVARDYLRANAPLHFALPIFDEEHPNHKLVTGKA